MRAEFSNFLHRKEGVPNLAEELTIGHQVSNQLRLSTITHNEHPDTLSIFGIDSIYAFNHVQWSDHGLDHVRRMHRLMDLLINSMPDVFKKIKNPTFLYAFELFPYFHDLDQLLTLMDNNIQERNGSPRDAKPKKGHALAAAVMIMAMTDKYMRSVGMDKSELTAAEQITATAALMMMKHDEPETLDQALSRKNKITGDDLKKLTDDELVKQFNENKLDLFSLSRSQVMKILLKTKADGTEYGLYREFAREYKPVLERMKKDDRPLLLNPNDNDIESIQALTHIAVLADKIDMVYPPFPSIIRLLNTKISRKRDWWSKSQSSEKMFKIITEKGGNYDEEGDCDVRRLLWEALDSARQTKVDSQNIINNDYTRKLSLEHSVMRILALKEFGQGIMTGNIPETIEKIYKERLGALDRKVERRRGQKIMTAAQLTDRYDLRVRALNEEKAKIKKMLAEKKGIDSVGDFLTTCDLVLNEVCKIFSIEPDGEEVRRLKKQIHSETTEFYSTYDSLGGVPDIWRAPENQNNYELYGNLINGYIHGNDFYQLRMEALVKLRNKFGYTINKGEFRFVGDAKERYKK